MWQSNNWFLFLDFVFHFLGFGWDLQSLVANEEFQHILRVLNTNVDGKQKIMFALTSIKGIGRRFANIVCKKADVDMNKRSDFLFIFSWFSIRSATTLGFYIIDGRLFFEIYVFFF